MLQGGTQISEMVAVSDFVFAHGGASLRFCDPPLETESDDSLGTFHPEMREYDVEKSFSGCGASDPRVRVSRSPLARISLPSTYQATASDTATESLLEFNEKRSVAVRNLDLEPEPRSFPSLRPDDGYTAVSVKDPGDVLDVMHQNGLSARGGMVANSGELRCPARKGAEGQSRAKQESGVTPGVCNEHVPPPKGKMCSALTGNRERSAEMTGPIDLVYGVGAVKSMRNIQGDRQCPAGRAYLLRTEDTHFMVDPRFLFEWTAPLTYPDQLAFTRICGLRFFLKTDRRMFEAVYDGVTA